MPLVLNRILLKIETIKISENEFSFFKDKVSSVQSLSRVRLLATPWTAAYQAPSMGVSRQEYWSGVPLPSPDLSVNLI